MLLPEKTVFSCYIMAFYRGVLRAVRPNRILLETTTLNIPSQPQCTINFKNSKKKRKNNKQQITLSLYIKQTRLIKKHKQAFDRII